ncbi:hypothetical protein IU438_20065 [Nocardia cyriacigeorgica]|uniref:hypothetical protein n=1 Tax=Nocardia cyriacigeorgica TaxID=135487 RepID=UPI001894C7F3|nr:hypothetical protein [Nocardia cyriacigeorgica]MBF6398080.1 hypothetical protein [Nocardia cyriacigeorgica]MBF6404406.1 hypothetical protein [Nocardia cyriacigeorgica]
MASDMKWLLIAAVATILTIVGPLLVLLAAFTGITNSAGERYFSCQCDSAIGPDPSVTEAAAPGSSVCDSDEEWDPADVPTTNPFLSMTPAPDETEISDYQRACLSAISSASAPLQVPALRRTNAGFAVECARELAYARVGSRADGSASAAVVRDVIYEASLAAVSTGNCVAGSRADGASGGAVPRVEPGTTAPIGSCGPTTPQAAVALPDTIAGQGLCGQRVRSDAVSPGDLVFWDYRDNAPTRVGIAVEPTRVIATDPDTGEYTAGYMRVVAADPATGEFAVLDVSSDSDARAKRVLAGEPN